MRVGAGVGVQQRRPGGEHACGLGESGDMVCRGVYGDRPDEVYTGPFTQVVADWDNRCGLRRPGRAGVVLGCARVAGAISP